MQEQSGAPGFLQAAIVFGFDLSQAGKEIGVISQLPCPSVIGMTVMRGIGQDNVRAVLTDSLDERQLIWLAVFEKTICEIHITAVSQSKNFCGGGGLSVTDLGAAPCAQLDRKSTRLNSSH